MDEQRSEQQNDSSLWFILSAIGLFSIWYAATKRTQNPLWLIMAALSVITLAYRLYGRFVALRVAKASDVPEDADDIGRSLSVWALGYHFAAIAGAGALIAPVAVVQYGFLPGVLWVLVGACLAGASPRSHGMVEAAGRPPRDGAPARNVLSSRSGLREPWFA